jgi:NAD(P)-dependent dehydrogenase (short-subunit alcohol dehydrogenase family)
MKTAMIWGAGGGIGRALVDKLREEGWTVFAVAHDATAGDAAAVHALEADVTEEFDVQQAVMAAGQEAEAVDLWIYAAGDITAVPVSEMDAAAWNRIIGANLTGPYLTLRHSLPLLADEAHIVIFGAVSERLRLPRLSAYAAAKAGVEAFAEALRKEERNRRVTLVRPGAVDTPLWDKTPMQVPKDAASPQKVAQRILTAYTEGHTGQLDLT